MHLSDGVGEQEADGFTVVGTSAGFGKGRADIDGLDLIALLLLLGVRDGVGHNDTAKAAVVDVFGGLAGEDTVDNNGVHLLGTVLHDGVGSLDEGTAGIGHIVNNNSNLVLHVADEDHARDLVRAGTLLVDQGELQIKAVGDSSGTVLQLARAPLKSLYRVCRWLTAWHHRHQD